MLEMLCERKNKDKFILEEKIPIAMASTSPLEHVDDILLSGNFSTIRNAKLDFSTREVINSSSMLESFVDSSIKSATKDLSRLPDNPYLLNNLGKTLLNGKDTDEAIKIFNKAISIKPDFTIALFNLGLCYEKKRDFNSAMYTYDKVLQNNPSDIRALTNVANLYFRNKKMLEAKKIFTEVLKKDEKNVAALDKLALINLLGGNFKKAIAFLKKCLQLNSNLPATYNNLGVSYAAIGLHKKAKECFKVSLQLFPNYKVATINLATFFRQNGDHASSIELLEGYLRYEENLEIIELLARTYLSISKFEKSLLNLKKAIQLASDAKLPNRDFGRILNNLGVIFHKMGKYKEAEEKYQNCISRAGIANPVIVSNLIDLYFVINKFDKAKEYIDILHEQFPKNKSFYYNYARYAYNSGNIKDAIKYSLLSIENNKEFLPAYPFLSCLYSENLKKYKMAIKLNEKAIKIFPEDKIVINNLAYNYLMNNEISKASNIISIIPDNEFTIFLYATKGLLRIKEGDTEEGSRLYNFAAKLAKIEDLQKKVLQKKNLELAKYYINIKKINRAKIYLSKVTSIKASRSFYAIEAADLLNSIQ